MKARRSIALWAARRRLPQLLLGVAVGLPATVLAQTEPVGPPPPSVESYSEYNASETTAQGTSVQAALEQQSLRPQASESLEEPDDTALAPSPFESFEEADAWSEEAFVMGDYEGVMQALGQWLFPTPPFAPDTRLVEVYQRFGTSAMLLGYEDSAERSYTIALGLAPEAELDPFIHPAEAVALFERVAFRLGGIADTVNEDFYVVQVVREQSLLVSALPFGLGFFNRKEDVTGVLYLISQLGLAATSGTFYALNESSRDALGFFPDAARARRRQSIHLSTGILFLTTATANSIHGMMSHEPVIEIEYRMVEGVPDILDADLPASQ